MDHPKLKHPRLCRILTYVVILGCSILPIFIVFSFPVHDAVRAVVILAVASALIAFLFRYFMVLAIMDMMLAFLSCHKTARKQYTLSPGRSADAILRSLRRYGIACNPQAIAPQPSALRYKFSSPLTIFSCGIERIVAAYEVDLLDKQGYQCIFRSAKSNSNSLKGKKKAIFLDKNQKKSPLNRVTVIVILARRIDPRMAGELYDLVCKQCGDESKDCVVPCVVDLEHHTCVFNCLRMPFTGYSYPAKNRGIRIIKSKVFGGNLNLRGNDHYLPYAQDLSPELPLWDLWKELTDLHISAEREIKQCFKSLSEREIRIIDEQLYLKWDTRGICQNIKSDPESKTVKIESVEYWTYPKSRPIGKTLIQELKDHITAYYARQGYTAEFEDFDALE